MIETWLNCGNTGKACPCPGIIFWNGGWAATRMPLFLKRAPGPDGRRSVIKLVREYSVGSAARLAMWQRTRQLRHPNLLELLDCGRAELGGEIALYAVFEAADDTWHAALKQSPLSEAEAREVLTAVLDALEYLQISGSGRRRARSGTRGCRGRPDQTIDRCAARSARKTRRTLMRCARSGTRFRPVHWRGAPIFCRRRWAADPWRTCRRPPSGAADPAAPVPALASGSARGRGRRPLSASRRRRRTVFRSGFRWAPPLSCC